jgi:hypothetical protein
MKILVWNFFDNYGDFITKELKKKHLIYRVNFLDKKNLAYKLSNIEFLVKNFDEKKFNKKKIFFKIYDNNKENWFNAVHSRGLFKNISFFQLTTLLKAQILTIHQFLKTEKFTHLIITPYLSMGLDYLTYKICKSLKIKTILVQSIFRNRFFYTYDLNDWGSFKLSKNNFKIIDNKDCLKRNEIFYMQDNFYLKTKFPLKIFFPRIFSIFLIKNILHKIQSFKNNLNLYKFWKLHNKKKMVSSNPPENYIYFALHFQAEATTIALANDYLAQNKAIKKLHDILPHNFKLIIKEHPAQADFYHRDEWFNKELKYLNKIIITNVNDDNFKLIRASKAIATLTGTIGFEALREGKPVITFGLAWYNFLPGVFKWHKNLNINKILKYKVDVDLINNKMRLITKKMGNGVDSIDWSHASDFTSGYQKQELNHNKESFITANSIQKLL